MARVRGKDTKPEMTLRRALTAAGLVGYRLHRRDLPGRPDLAYGRWRVAVFVDGAWWHGRADRFHPEKSSEFWQAKIARNIERDAEVNAALVAAGWAVVRFWDDKVTRDPAATVARVQAALVAAGR